MKLKVKRLLLRLLGLNFFLEELLFNLCKKKLKIWKLEAQEKIAEFIARGVITLLLVGLLGFASLFINLAIALYLNAAYNSSYLGFLIVAGVYMLLFLFVFIFKEARWFRKFFSR